MAYRPPIVRPPGRPNLEALIRARLERQALVQALAQRLSFLVGPMRAGPATDWRPPLPGPAMAARPPIAPAPIRPPMVQPTAVGRPQRPTPQFIPPASVGIAPLIPGPSMLPSASDWVRQPGFYESDTDWGP